MDEDTLIYCGHEYTEANLQFATTVEPDNADIKQRIETVREQRQKGLPSIPATLLEEKASNPFLRTEYAHIHEKIEDYCGKSLEQPAEVFAELRRWKDQFS